MKKFSLKIISLFLCITICFSLSACQNTEEDLQKNEQESKNDVALMGEEQGIGVMSACRLENDVAGIIVYNNTEKTLQYAEITASFSDNVVYSYSLTTLPPGEACIVEEVNSSPYRELTTGFFGFKVTNVAFFAEEPSVYSDKLQFSGADGIINVKNISGEAIKDNIIVYFKDYEDYQFVSGKTYRITVDGGLEAGEIKQISANNFKNGKSMIMMIQFVPAEVS